MAFGLMSGLPLASKVGSGSILSGEGLSGALGLSNPLRAGLSVLSALGGLGGSKIDASSAATQSGLGVFAPENNVKKNQPAIDFSQPLQVALLALAGVVVIYIYKKVV